MWNSVLLPFEFGSRNCVTIMNELDEKARTNHETMVN